MRGLEMVNGEPVYVVEFHASMMERIISQLAQNTEPLDYLSTRVRFMAPVQNAIDLWVAEIYRDMILGLLSGTAPESSKKLPS